jgi:UDP-N-acetylglucosamine 1-carboxyvinyltransferase
MDVGTLRDGTPTTSPRESAEPTEKATMDALIIRGGRPLNGRVDVSGAKNAALPLMAATLLTPGVHTLRNVPLLSDTRTMARVLEQLGASVEFRGHLCKIDTSRVNSVEAPYDLVRTMRASIYVLGPLLARFGAARVSLPGGCAWGPRPVNLHIEGIRKLGAEVELKGGYIVARASRLTGARIHFDVSSVGATGNVLMAAVLARGITVIENAAIEPEITALAEFLSSMGARIDGIGTNRLEIEGVDDLHPADVVTIPDRIEAGTFLVAAALTGGSVTVEKVVPEHFSALTARLEDAGCRMTVGESSVSLQAPGTLRPVDVSAAIYPGFPTDMQAQWIALMAIAEGTSVVTDTIYFDRFKHVPELVRLGANIEMKENAAIVRGVKRLTGATVMSTDLRASASLILAGLVAEGTTEVLRVYHIDRGYETIEKKLKALGASIDRVKGDEF